MTVLEEAEVRLSVQLGSLLCCHCCISEANSILMQSVVSSLDSTQALFPNVVIHLWFSWLIITEGFMEVKDFCAFMVSSQHVLPFDYFTLTVHSPGKAANSICILLVLLIWEHCKWEKDQPLNKVSSHKDLGIIYDKWQGFHFYMLWEWIC